MMRSGVQFINFTGDFSSESQDTQRKLVRSHAAFERQRQRRQRDIENHLQRVEKNDNLLLHVNLAPKPRPGQVNPQESVGEASERSQTQNHLRPSTHDVLRPVHEGGHLLPLPVAPSPHSYLGQGTRDWFIPLPLIRTHRMSKHIFYCMHPPFK